MKAIELKDTIDNMTSEDYRQRFIAEYDQLRIRILGLRNMLNQMFEGELDSEPTCNFNILQRQLQTMTMYALILESRAEEEGIEIYKLKGVL